MASLAASATAPRRAAQPTAESAANKSVKKPKKLSEATVETTAETFLALFKSLPGAIQWRVVQKMEEYETQLEATRADTNEADSGVELNNQPNRLLDQVISEYEAMHNVSLGSK